MKNLNKIHFRDIKNYLLKNNLKFTSKISDNEFFYNINSIANSNKENLTFFTDTNSTKNLLKTKAKACIININNSILMICTILSNTNVLFFNAINHIRMHIGLYLL